MIVVETDLQRNLLTVTYCGHVVPGDFGRAMGDLQAALAHLPPGFRLLTDLGGLESMDYACAPLIDTVMDLTNARGVSEVVRIVPDPKKDIGFRVMSYFHYGANVAIVTCETSDEAMAALGAGEAE
jgi:hypothetical protein